MGTVTISIKLKDTLHTRIKQISHQLNYTSDEFIKQAIFYYLYVLEQDIHTNIPLLETNEIFKVETTCNQQQLTIKTENKQIIDQKYHQSSPHEITKNVLPHSILRSAVTAAWYRPETEAVLILLKKFSYPTHITQKIQVMSLKLAHTLRNEIYNKRLSNSRISIVQNLLQEFSLSSQEGISLMCLAEALLRIPDKATRNALIRDKISHGNWKNHLNNTQSIFVNAMTWGLLLTGKVVRIHNQNNLFRSLKSIISKGGEPLILKGVDIAVRLMGKQFISGKNINQALANTRCMEKRGFLYSYDMLGEAALTEEDVQAYFISYKEAIHAIGKNSNGRGIYEGPGISIKLSALHPRYCRTQYQRVTSELYPRLLELTLLAKKYDIGLNIDAEEADRLEMSLDLLTKLCFELDLEGWNGIGFVIQAYQKRSLEVIDELIDLAKRSKHRLMIRLVKGAYWDSEIKYAQVEGFKNYSVFTRKVYTDLSYLVCARKLLNVSHDIYPQFATHNTHTLSAIYHFAGLNYYHGQYEFQCLYGMGEPLYEQVVGKITDNKLNRPCRIYAPVGNHEMLLAYLVRRILENGANTSFIHCIADHSIPLDKLIIDPVQEINKLAASEGSVGLPHLKIPLPCNLYGTDRRNSTGLNFANEHDLTSLLTGLFKNNNKIWQAHPIVIKKFNDGKLQIIHNPADHNEVIGECKHSSHNEIMHALSAAVHHTTLWSNTLITDRASILKRAANYLETEMYLFISLLIREAGKNFSNAIAEVREAVDFLRYYACQIERNFDNEKCKPLGPVVCISPWNFPLAIFIGQIAAALAAGNTVLAKPAEQTPLIATQAIYLMLKAGVPLGVLQLLPGDGATVGGTLVADPRVLGVIFTGSTQVARILQTILASRLNPQGNQVPLIAETGGVNVMLVDSSALTEQVVNDVLTSAFDSAGQRCSALRLLYIQEEVAERTLHMLRGAMVEYIIGNPKYLATDIGPVIDINAKTSIENHILAMRESGHVVWQTPILNVASNIQGNFVPLTLIELKNIKFLSQEIFGPVLHVVRYKRNELKNIITQINKSSYGLTLGLHTRIDETTQYVIENTYVGNYYINRNIVGAVVGVQPFGGTRLSGTGPKAGGPLYLYRLLSRYSNNENGVLPALTALDTVHTVDFSKQKTLQQAHSVLINWMEKYHSTLVSQSRYLGKISQAGSIRLLTGPTGEQNSYRLLPRKQILCLANQEQDLLIQLAVITSIGSKALWVKSLNICRLFDTLPSLVKKYVLVLDNWQHEDIELDAVLFHGNNDQMLSLIKTLSTRTGPLISVHNYTHGNQQIILEYLLIEQSISINTAAVGGNTSLITMQ